MLLRRAAQPAPAVPWPADSPAGTPAASATAGTASAAPVPGYTAAAAGAEVPAAVPRRRAHWHAPRFQSLQTGEAASARRPRSAMSRAPYTADACGFENPPRPHERDACRKAPPSAPCGRQSGTTDDGAPRRPPGCTDHWCAPYPAYLPLARDTPFRARCPRRRPLPPFRPQNRRPATVSAASSLRACPCGTTASCATR